MKPARAERVERDYWRQRRANHSNQKLSLINTTARYGPGGDACSTPREDGPGRLKSFNGVVKFFGSWAFKVKRKGWCIGTNHPKLKNGAGFLWQDRISNIDTTPLLVKKYPVPTRPQTRIPCYFLAAHLNSISATQWPFITASLLFADAVELRFPIKCANQCVPVAPFVSDELDKSTVARPAATSNDIKGAAPDSRGHPGSMGEGAEERRRGKAWSQAATA